MSRQVRFRVFMDGQMLYPPFDFWMHDGEFNTMLEGVAITKKKDGKVYEVSGIMMMSTGLFDKNGKEIWEGDLITAPACCDRGPHEVIYEVRYHSGFFIKYLDHETGFMAFDKGKFANEVVGNVYQTKEEI